MKTQEMNGKFRRNALILLIGFIVLSAVFAIVLCNHVHFSTHAESATDPNEIPKYEFYLDDVSLSSVAVTTTSDRVSYVEAGAYNEAAVLSVRFAEELDPAASVKVVVGDKTFYPEGNTVTLGNYSGKVDISLVYTYAEADKNESSTIYFGINKLDDNLYLISGDWSMSDLPNVKNVLTSPKRAVGDTTSTFEAQLVVIGVDEIKINGYVNGMSKVTIDYERTGKTISAPEDDTIKDASNITQSNFSRLSQIQLANSEATILTLKCNTDSGIANDNNLNRTYLQIWTKKIPLPEECNWTVRINNQINDIVVSPGDTVEFDYFDKNDFTFTAPVLGIGDTCTLSYYDSADDKQVAEEMKIDQDAHYYPIGVIDSDYSFTFKYAADGYVDSEFTVNVKFNVGDRTIEDILIKESSSPIEIINDALYPYAFDSTISTAETQFVVAGNGAVNSSISYLEIRMHNEDALKSSGMLSFDYYILGLTFGMQKDSAFWSIGEKVTSTDGTPSVPSGSNTNCGYLKSGELKSYKDWQNNSESSGLSGEPFSTSTSIPITFAEGETEKIFYLAYYQDNDTDFLPGKFGVANIRFYAGAATIDYAVSNAASGSSIELKVDGVIKDSGAQLEKGNKAELTATVAAGYKFYGWADNGEYVSRELSISFSVIGDRSLTAVIEPAGTYHARIDGTFYATTEAAIAAAQDGDFITLLEDDAITTNVTLNAGVTLLLPYSVTDTTGKLIGNTDNSEATVSWTNADSISIYKYLTLTVGNGVEFNISGTVIVGAVQHHPSRFAQGHTSGAYSTIVNNGDINIKHGGVLYNYGLIEGSGRVYTQNGAYLYTPFVINDYCGGSNTSNLYGAKQFPFSQFATINITCAQRVDYGATVMGMTSLYFYESVTTQDVRLVGKIEDINSDIGSLIWLEEGSYLEIGYDSKSIEKVVINSVPETTLSLKDNGVTTIKVYGNITAGSFSLQGYGSKNMVLAIPYTYNFDLMPGARVNILADYAYKIMPGAVVTVKEGAEINIAEGGALYVYDGLIQGPKSGKRYPSAAELEVSDFAQSGMLILDGTLNISGSFAGIVQSTSNTGVINTSASATLSNITIKEGSAGYYMDDRAEFLMDARVNTLRGMLTLQAGKSYKAFSTGTVGTFVLESFSVVSASGIADTELTVQLNQAMSGVFAEYDSERDKYIWDIEVYIGEAVANVDVIIGGKRYTTDANGKFSLSSYYGDTLTYYTDDFETAGNKTFTIGVDFEYTLTDIIKSVALASDNIYERVYGADGELEKDFKLNAVISYYGSRTDYTTELEHESTLSKYVNQVTLSSKIVTTTFSQKLYVAPRSFAEYQAQAATIKTAQNIPQAAAAAYQSYLALLGGKDSDDVAYAKEYLTDSTDYLDIIVSINVASVTYGDTTASATLTTVDRRTSSAMVQLVGYTGTNPVVGKFSWSGTYATKDYTVECSATQVLGKALTVTVVSKTSIYGDAIVELEATIDASKLVGADQEADIFSLSKQSGDAVGSYDIIVTNLHKGYALTIVNDTDAYTIKARDITLTVADHDDIMLQSAVQNTIIDLTTSVGNWQNVANLGITYKIYNNKDMLLVATMNANGLSANLPIGEYKVEAVTSNTNFNVTSSTKGSLKIVSNNDYYTVTVRYYIAAGTYITGHEYDGSEVKVEVSVIITSSKAVVDSSGFTYTVKKSGKAATIKNAGTYTVDVKVGNVEYNNASSITVAQRELALVWGNSSFTYDGTAVAPTVSATNIVGEEEVLLTVSGAETDYGEDYTAQAELSGKDSGNYMLPSPSTTLFSIAKRAITVTVDKLSSVYGDALKTLSATITEGALAEADKNKFYGGVISLAFEKDVIVKDKGEYDVVVTFNDNYTVEVIGDKKAYTITAREISVVPNNITVDYGDAEQTLTAALALNSSLNKGDELDDIISLSRAEGKDVGEYAITVTSKSDNYTVTQSEAIYKIKPLLVTITVEDLTSEYGDELAAAQLSIEGKTGYAETAYDIVAVDFLLVQPLKVGTYNITAKKTSNNYTVTIRYTTADHSVYTVSKRKVTITAGATDGLVTGEGDERITFTDVQGVLTFSTSNLLDKDKTAFENSIEPFVKIGSIELTSANFDDIICGGDHAISARFTANDSYEVTVIEGTLSITRPYVYTRVTNTTYTYTGAVIEAFDYTINIVGYLQSATGSTFAVTYYLKDDQEKTTPVELKDAGEYVMQISIVHDSAYLWRADAVKEYNITINKKDISDSIIVNGAKQDGYVVMSDRLNIFTTFAGDYADYELQIKEVLSGADGVIERDIDGFLLTSAGTYTYSVEIDNDNYCGRQEIVFDVYAAAVVEIAAQFVEKQNEIGAQPNTEQLFALRELNNRLTEAQRDALLGSDADFKAAYEAYCEAWEQEVAEVNSDFEIANKVYSNMALAFAVVPLTTTLAAAIFVLFKGRF